MTPSRFSLFPRHGPRLDEIAAGYNADNLTGLVRSRLNGVEVGWHRKAAPRST
jgi:hypothetical protein